MIRTQVPFITGSNELTKDDNWIMGSPFFNSHIAANLYYGDKAGIILTGTVAVAGDAVTGAGTTFTTDLNVGGYVSFAGDATLKTYRVKSIASDTALVIFGNVTIVAGAVATKSDLNFLGCTLKAGAKLELGKVASKCSQQGESDSDMIVNKYDLSIDAELTKAGLERMKSVLQGLFIKYNVATGLIEGAAITVPFGESDLQIAKQLHMIAVRAMGESTDPMDHLIIPLAAPTASGEWTLDGSSQMSTKTLFKGYLDQDTLTADGVPVLAYMGTIS